MKELSPRQERFVHEYSIDRNGAQAAIRAGYSRKAAKETAYKLLTICHVAKAVEKRTQETSERLRITRETVLRGLLDAAARAKAEGNAMGLISAWREVAKLMGYYPSNRVQIEATVTTSEAPRPREIEIEQMTDDELLDLIGGDEAEELRAWQKKVEPPTTRG